MEATSRDGSFTDIPAIVRDRFWEVINTEEKVHRLEVVADCGLPPVGALVRPIRNDSTLAPLMVEAHPMFDRMRQLCGRYAKLVLVPRRYRAEDKGRTVYPQGMFSTGTTYGREKYMKGDEAR